MKGTTLKISKHIPMSTKKTHLPNGSNQLKKTKMVNDIKSGRTQGLHFSLEQTNQNILIWEDKVLEANMLVGDLQPKFHQAEKVYLEQKAIMDKALQQRNEAEGILTMFKNYRNGAKQDKPGRALTTTSATAKPPKQSKIGTTVRWTEVVPAVLQQVNQFLTYDDLLAKLSKVNQQAYELFVAPPNNKIKYYGLKVRRVLLRDIMENSQIEGDFKQPPRGRRIYRLYAVYNDHIGLKEWVDEQGEPLPEYRNKMLFRGNVKVG